MSKRRVEKAKEAGKIRKADFINQKLRIATSVRQKISERRYIGFVKSEE